MDKFQLQSDDLKKKDFSSLLEKSLVNVFQGKILTQTELKLLPKSINQITGNK